MTQAVANPKLVDWSDDDSIRPARFSHIVLNTKRFPEMSAWYRTVLGAKPLFSLPHAAFLTFDDEHHRVLIVDVPDLEDRPPRAEGVAHYAYLFDSLGELMATYARLRDEAGIRPTYCVNHGFQFSLYYHDPDNNEVELGCDNFATREEMDAWFQNGRFAKNFFGYVFDPEAAYALHASGAPDAEVFEQTYQGEAPDLSRFYEEG